MLLYSRAYSRPIAENVFKNRFSRVPKFSVSTDKKKYENNYEDIYDGSVYRKKVADGFLSDARNISFMWNTDRVQIFKSAKFNIWPFYLVCNELSYAQR